MVLSHRVLIPLKHPTAIATKIAALKDLSCPQTYESEKKHPARYSHSQPSPIKPAAKPIGVRTTKPKTNLAIAADFPSIVAYNLYMLEEENSRLKGLLVATTSIYVFGWVVGLALVRVIDSNSYIIWLVEHSWGVYITWLFLFLVYCWIPLSIFLLVQGFILRKKYSDHSYAGDRTIGNLSVVVPLVFFSIYVATRLIYGA